MVAQSGGEVNRLLDRRLVECLPATDAAHGDLPRGHQQNSMAAVSALGSAHWVFTRRLNSPCRRSMALVVRKDFHCCGG